MYARCKSTPFCFLVQENRLKVCVIADIRRDKIQTTALSETKMNRKRIVWRFEVTFALGNSDNH